MCNGPCLGQFCDMLVGECADCGNQNCEPDCRVNADCPERLTCIEVRGTCYWPCGDGCHGAVCQQGVCVFPGQI